MKQTIEELKALALKWYEERNEAIQLLHRVVYGKDYSRQYPIDYQIIKKFLNKIKEDK